MEPTVLSGADRMRPFLGDNGAGSHRRRRRAPVTRRATAAEPPRRHLVRRGRGWPRNRSTSSCSASQARPEHADQSAADTRRIAHWGGSADIGRDHDRRRRRRAAADLLRRGPRGAPARRAGRLMTEASSERHAFWRLDRLSEVEQRCAALAKNLDRRVAAPSHAPAEGAP